MKRHALMALGFLLLAIAPLTAQEPERKDARVTFKVVDDVDNPVAGVHAHVFDAWKTRGYSGPTDANGIFSTYWYGIRPLIVGIFTKQGFYRTQGNLWIGELGGAPTNTLTATLKRIINPVPMVKRDVRLLFPILGKPVGFDCEVGDWVEPHGQGNRVDFWVTGINTSEGWDVDCLARFATSNSLDGFISFPFVRDIYEIYSHFQPPQEAAETGYTNCATAYNRLHRDPITSRRVCEQSFVDEPEEYYFRIRSETNQLGEIVKANVGWFEKSLKPSPGRTNTELKVSFSYYYNPDPQSRSLEPKEIADKQ